MADFYVRWPRLAIGNNFNLKKPFKLNYFLLSKPEFGCLVSEISHKMQIFFVVLKNELVNYRKPDSRTAQKIRKIYSISYCFSIFYSKKTL
jgi:hypothetical protein